MTARRGAGIRAMAVFGAALAVAGCSAGGDDGGAGTSTGSAGSSATAVATTTGGTTTTSTTTTSETTEPTTSQRVSGLPGAAPGWLHEPPADPEVLTGANTRCLSYTADGRAYDNVITGGLTTCNFVNDAIMPFMYDQRPMPKPGEWVESKGWRCTRPADGSPEGGPLECVGLGATIKAVPRA